MAKLIMPQYHIIKCNFALILMSNDECQNTEIEIDR